MLASGHPEPAMNAFYEHHKDSIRFGYRCFDRILLNGLIQPFQQPERVVGFFDTYRHLYPVSRDLLRGAADQFHGSLAMATTAVGGAASGAHRASAGSMSGSSADVSASLTRCMLWLCVRQEERTP